jgi:uncharacterized membrane protein
MGVTLLLLVVFTIALISRLNLLGQQIQAIETMLERANNKLEHATRQILSSDEDEDNSE